MTLPVVEEESREMVNAFFDSDNIEETYRHFFEMMERENPLLGIWIKARMASKNPAMVSQSAGMIAVYSFLRMQDSIDSSTHVAGVSYQ